MVWTLPNQMFTGGFAFPFPSNWANVINFLLFDVVLITIVYTASSDVAGRLNHYDTSDGKPRQLHLCSPPIVGGGICSTRKLHAYMLLACRIVALALVMLSNLSIEGSDHDSAYKTTVQMRVPGSLENWNKELFLDAVASRSGCQVTNAEGEAVYGDLRKKEDSELYECIADQELLDKPLITGHYQEVNIRADNCRKQLLFRRQQGPNFFNVSVHFCDSATIRCAQADSGFVVGCSGVFRGLGNDANNTYLCDDDYKIGNGTVRKGCLPVRNLDMMEIGWMYALKFTFPPPFIIDEINAMYTAKVVTRKVKATRRKGITHVSPMWFLVMALKVFIAVALLIGSCFLWSKGHQPVAHDENALAELISAGIQQQDNNNNHGDSMSFASVNETTKSWKSTSNMSTSSDIFLNADNSANGGVVVYAEGYNASDWSANNPNHLIDQMERQHW